MENRFLALSNDWTIYVFSVVLLLLKNLLSGSVDLKKTDFLWWKPKKRLVLECVQRTWMEGETEPASANQSAFMTCVQDFLRPENCNTKLTFSSHGWKWADLSRQFDKELFLFNRHGPENLFWSRGFFQHEVRSTTEKIWNRTIFIMAERDKADWKT